MVPIFKGASIYNLFLYRKIWKSLIICAGNIDPNIERIDINRIENYSGFAASVSTYDGKLDIKYYDDDAYDKYVITHEFAHAWFHMPVSTLSEGFANWMEKCSFSEEKHYIDNENHIKILTYMENLKTWKNKHDAPFETRDHSYEASYRFVNSINMSIGKSENITYYSKIKNVKNWDDFFNFLKSQNNNVFKIIEDFINEDTDFQRDMLMDHEDRDGLIDLSESLLGTDKNKWDTDGDGWWDGQASIVDAVPLRPGGGEVCIGYGKKGDVFEIIGDVKYFPLIKLNSKHIRHIESNNNKIKIKENGSITAEFSIWIPEPTGGSWVKYLKDREDPSCFSNTLFTIMNSYDPNMRLNDVAEKVKSKNQIFSIKPMYSETRLVIELGGTDTVISYEQKVILSNVVVQQLHKLPDGVASGIVAAWAARRFPVPIRAAIAEGFLQHLTSQETSSVFSSNTEMVAETHRVAAACPTGWRGLIDGSCVLR